MDVYMYMNLSIINSMYIKFKYFVIISLTENASVSDICIFVSYLHPFILFYFIYIDYITFFTFCYFFQYVHLIKSFPIICFLLIIFNYSN